MAVAYVGEIRCFGFNFAPYQWAQCNGQLISVQQNPTLFAIIGTFYGGNGTTSFQLPNLQGQVPMHWGTTTGLPTTVVGQVQGSVQVGLTTQNLPQHQHPINVARAGTGEERSATPTSNSFIANAKGGFIYQSKSPTANTQFAPTAIGMNGGTSPHDNMQPYLALNFCISLAGVYPSRS